MIDLFKQNQKAAWFIVASIAAVLLTSTLAACQLQDLIRVDVPAGVQGAIQTEPKIPLSETDAAWDEWVAWVDRESGRFADSISKGNETASVIRSLTETGLSLGRDAAATLPGGALISSTLALLGGLFLKTPGTDKKIAKEKEASYNAGIDKGRAAATATLESTGTPTTGTA